MQLVKSDLTISKEKVLGACGSESTLSFINSEVVNVITSIVLIT